MPIVVCPHCGAKNRVDVERARAGRPTCGKCGTPLPAGGGAEFDGSRPVEVTDGTFAQLISAAGQKPVLVDCWAPWCGPCRMVAPVIDQLAAESAGRFLVAKLNTDENQSTAAALRINAIPTILIYKSGKLVERLEGVRSKGEMVAALMRHA